MAGDELTVGTRAQMKQGLVGTVCHLACTLNGTGGLGRVLTEGRCDLTYLSKGSVGLLCWGRSGSREASQHVIVITWVKDGGSLNQSDSSRGGERWSDSGCI